MTVNVLIKTLLIPCLLSAASLVFAGQEISGDWYNWQRTLKPEQPWLHDYSQTLVMKISLYHEASSGGTVYLTYEQALEVIRKLDNITLGIPKIVYLTGWQSTGRDPGYPSWDVFNESLKRTQDQSALQSLKWLLNEAKRYHTTVSLHINMFDAFKDSPLWKTYDQMNVIIKDASGAPIKGEVFGGVQSYQISYAQEWKLGLSQKRIDGLLQLLPELKGAGTIHIDAFHSVQPVRPSMQPARRDSDQFSSPYLGFRTNDEVTAQRKIIRYWRMKGLDVTAEDDTNHMKPDPFIGLQPMAWLFEPENFRLFDWLNKPADFAGLPAALYSGTPMQAQEEIARDPQKLGGLAQQFCEKVVPWYYANNPGRKESGFNWTPNEYGVFVPALWRGATIVACARVDLPNPISSHRWRLPTAWGEVSSVRLMRITTDGLKQQAVLPVANGTIELTLKAGDQFAIER